MERTPVTYAYTFRYPHESDEEHAAHLARLTAHSPKAVLCDDLPVGFKAANRGIALKVYEKLDRLVRMLLPGDVVLVAAVDRIGYTLHEFAAVLEHFAGKGARVRFLDVEELYGDEEPPNQWFVRALASKLAVIHEAGRKHGVQKRFGEKWIGVGWTRRKSSGKQRATQDRWQANNVMRHVGHRIVILHDQEGKRFDTIAKRLNAEGLHYRDCSLYSSKPWNERFVREYYQAARNGWPPPRREKTPVIRDKNPLQELPPKRTKPVRKVRQSEVEYARRGAELAADRVAKLERLLAEQASAAAPLSAETHSACPTLSADHCPPCDSTAGSDHQQSSSPPCGALESASDARAGQDGTTAAAT